MEGGVRLFGHDFIESLLRNKFGSNGYLNCCKSLLNLYLKKKIL